MAGESMKVFILCLLVLVGCAQSPTTPPISKPPVFLSWEADHSERAPWSAELIKTLRNDFEIFDSAKDLTSFCPKYKSLSRDLKLKAIGEFWVAVAYYESGFNPKSSSVDVGTKGDRNSYSDGLYQLSGNDSSAKALNVDYKLLQDPLINIRVSLYQLKKQIQAEGLYMLPNSSRFRYWAVALSGNRFSQIPKIKARVLKAAPNCS